MEYEDKENSIPELRYVSKIHINPEQLEKDKVRVALFNKITQEADENNFSVIFDFPKGSFIYFPVSTKFGMRLFPLSQTSYEVKRIAFHISTIG